MTAAEFDAWIEHHDAAFPGFAKFFESGTPQQVQLRSTLWLRRLAEITPAQMAAQTEAMFNSHDKPKFLGDHIHWISARLRPRPLLNDTSRHVDKCELCNGTGIVDCEWCEQQFTPGGCPLPDNRGPAACRCSRGQWLQEKRQSSTHGTMLQNYDERRMRLIRYRAQEQAR